MRVALVVMPGAPLTLVPLGVASLKAYLGERGIPVDVHYLNLKLHGYGIDLDNIRFEPQNCWNEWFFSYHLFGPGGTGELKEELDDILVKASFQKVAARFPRETLERWLHEDIPAFLRDSLRDIPWEEYDLIGFSSIFASHSACLALAKKLKEAFPDKPIAFGGSNVEGEMGIATLKGCGWIDYVVDGEAEEALTALVRNLEDGKPHEKIPRVSFRNGSRLELRDSWPSPAVDMDALPVPDHDDYVRQLDFYRLRDILEPRFSFEASRGCWFGEKSHCAFCGMNGQAMGFRYKSTESALRDVLEIHRRYGANRLSAADNILGVRHLKELIPRLAEEREKLHADWEIHFEVKANLTESQMRALAAAGVTNLQPGIESLSTPLLKRMRKGVSAIQNIQALKLAMVHGITPAWLVLWGMPGEEAREYGVMAETMLALTHLKPPMGVAQIRVDRFSPYHFDWKRMGTAEPRPYEVYRSLYPTPRFDLREIAYFFRFGEPVSEEMRERAAVLRESAAFWESVWPRNFFAYARGVDFVTLYDCRPLRLNGGLELREDQLTELEARLFKFCRAIRGFGEIVEDCRREDTGADEARIRGILDEMVEKKWMYREGDRYLNLAIPLENLWPAQRVSFESMKRLKHDWVRRLAFA